jgi:apolipoprotein N-acyltransferase
VFGTFFVSFLMMLFPALLAAGMRGGIASRSAVRQGIPGSLCVTECSSAPLIPSAEGRVIPVSRLKAAWSGGKACFIAAAAIFTVNLSYGIVYPHVIPEPDSMIRVAAVQHNIPTTEGDLLRFEAALELAERTLGSETADMIIFPESTAQWLRENDYMQQRLSELARKYGAEIIIGGIAEPYEISTDEASADKSGRQAGGSDSATGITSIGSGSVYENGVHYVDSTGALSGEYYAKQHLVPFFENGNIRPFTLFPGHERGVLQSPLGGIGVIVCFESALPHVVRETVNAGANIVVVPSNDAYMGADETRRMHFSLAVLRAVETGRVVVQAATDGVTGAAWPTGEAFMLPLREEGVLLQEQPIYSWRTPYLVVGNSWLFIVLAVSLFFSAIAALGSRKLPH